MEESAALVISFVSWPFLNCTVYPVFLYGLPFRTGVVCASEPPAVFSETSGAVGRFSSSRLSDDCCLVVKISCVCLLGSSTGRAETSLLGSGCSRRQLAPDEDLRARQPSRNVQTAMMCPHLATGVLTGRQLTLPIY